MENDIGSKEIVSQEIVNKEVMGLLDRLRAKGLIVRENIFGGPREFYVASPDGTKELLTVTLEVV